jgi:PucR family transcriptional regulator, purine catabolism regulatory protein
VKANELDLSMLYKISTQHNQDDPQERMITIPTAAMGMLRRELIETIGLERTKGFLLRHGWHCGVSDARKVKELPWENKRELLLAGPKMHTLHGHLKVEVVVAEADFSKGTIHHEGIWKNSYEAEEHLKRFGLSDRPVCHTLVGYASGYLSSILGKKVIAKEIQCKAMGHEHCRAVCHTVKEWNGEVDQELKYYKMDNIIDELDQTFEKLKIERDNLSKAYEVHQKLTEEVLKENDLSSIASALHQITELPVFIEDVNLHSLAVAGLPQPESYFYSEKYEKLVNKIGLKRSGNLKNLKQTVFFEFSADCKRLITPIYLHRKIIGYCSFLYRETRPQEVDKLILEQGAVACSLYLLNERTRINTEQRIQGNFLDDILSNRITSEEMAKRAYYIGFQLNAPYFMIGICGSLQKPSVKEELEFNDDLINELSIFLKDRKINALLGQKSGNIVILLSECLLLKSHMNKQSFCKALFDYCSNKYPQYLFKLGISSSSDSIEEAPQLSDESFSALRIANRHQKIVFFDSLGIEGVMFQMKNVSPIQKFIQKKLGNLIEEDKSRDMELTKTLYYYLSHGCNVHKTARAMNFSISGLRYRLQKLNEILQTDINLPSVGHQMYLSLHFLIYWGELNIDVDVDIDEKEGIRD